MSRKIVVFGTRQIAEILTWYFERDNAFQVVAFTEDGEYVREATFQGRPVIAFEDVAQHHPPSSFGMFVALSYAKMNRTRATKYAAAKAAGYQLVSYVSPRAEAPVNLSVGDNSFVMDHNLVQPFARIGSDSFLWAGNHVGHHSVIGDHCFLASHIVVSGNVTIGDFCFVGVNATFHDGITVAPRCLVGAGTLIARDTEPDQVFMANSTPASRVPSSRIRI